MAPGNSGAPGIRSKTISLKGWLIVVDSLRTMRNLGELTGLPLVEGSGALIPNANRNFSRASARIRKIMIEGVF